MGQGFHLVTSSSSSDVKDNLALKKFTKQSSTLYYRGLALSSNLAVDGNLDTNTGERKSCTHTREQSNPWWGVDLGSRQKVSEVYIVNRGDCCGDRLSSFEIRVGMFLIFLNILLG